MTRAMPSMRPTEVATSRKKGGKGLECPSSVPCILKIELEFFLSSDKAPKPLGQEKAPKPLGH